MPQATNSRFLLDPTIWDKFSFSVDLHMWTFDFVFVSSGLWVVCCPCRKLGGFCGYTGGRKVAGASCEQSLPMKPSWHLHVLMLEQILNGSRERRSRQKRQKSYPDKLRLTPCLEHSQFWEFEGHRAKLFNGIKLMQV